MPLIEKAKSYLLDLVLENEEVKKFPQDFITASMQWVRSWFLVDDPVAEAVLNLPGNAEAKTKVVEAKLPKLLENPKFVQELEGQLAQYQQQRARLKNVLGENAEVEAGGHVRIGDEGTPAPDEGYDEMNVVKGKIKAGGNVTVGNTSYQVDGNFNVVNNYFRNPSADAPVPASALVGLQEELRSLVAQGRTGEAVAKLADLSGKAKVFHDSALLLSGRWEQLKRQGNMGTLSQSNANLERNQINAAVLSLIGDLGK